MRSGAMQLPAASCWLHSPVPLLHASWLKGSALQAHWLTCHSCIQASADTRYMLHCRYCLVAYGSATFQSTSKTGICFT